MVDEIGDAPLWQRRLEELGISAEDVTHLVRARWHRWLARNGGTLHAGVDREDLLAAGYEAALVALGRFDPNAGVKWSTWVCEHVQYAFLLERRASHFLTRRHRERLDRLGIQSERVPVEAFDRDLDTNDGGGEWVPPELIAASDTEADALLSLAAEDTRAASRRVRERVAELSEPKRTIIAAIYFHGEQRTPLAARLALTGSALRGLERSALCDLKRAMKESDAERD